MAASLLLLLFVLCLANITREILKKGNQKMALPIAPTPVLKGKEAESFLRKIHNESSVIARPIATPKLFALMETILKNASSNCRKK